MWPRQVRIVDLNGAELRTIGLPGLGSVGGFSGRPEDTETCYTFDSFLNPNEIYHYDFRTGTSTLFREPELDFDFSAYVTEQIFYPSRDGTRVPMFIVRRRDLPLDGANPTILYGYGGFNVSELPRFSPALLPWLERGGIYAVANLRGGGEYGETWHQGGMLKNKQNVLRRLHRRGRVPDRRRATPTPTGWPSTAAATAACWSAPWSTSVRNCSARPFPRWA